MKREFASIGAHSSQHVVVALSLFMALSACAPPDPRVPWNTEHMAREIAQDLRRFEPIDARFRQVEVLAWHTVEVQRRQPAGLQPLRRRGHDALVWLQVERAPGVPAWFLVHAEAGEDNPWRRVIINREVVAPLRHPRPGEDRDGTYHGFARYETPPTAEQVCEFARVAFFEPYLGPDARVVATNGRRRAWRRVTGAEPVCTVNE